MIKMNSIVKCFGSKTVLSGVTFEAKENRIFGLLGPSGAGKTTIINILTGQLTQDEGTFETGAKPFETGLMLDEDGLYPRLTCLQNLNVFADIYGISHEKSHEALKNVGLTEAAKKTVLELSKGMRQRLSLARAILHSPKVLFLDEPTSGLDPATARGIHKLIKNLSEAGSAIFLTTHNMDEAVKLCYHVALLHQGVIVEQGEPAQICEKYGAIKTVPDLESVFIKLTGVELE
ncbi:MAG: ABC transporter ATP-binding protein [Clostridiales bacterium]|jgi:ABC-2 type transport system ATP-binding protein|nr:ABC transporter ATP-binding protein [Clostridiales bacterium]